ncbi:MAG: cytochrome c oxidase subunit II [Bacteroidetes bacterium]|nr:cytochrome c oxidase subunit II [Bacteroidota bacterium]MCH8942876.1 cytochrome c oxidase subunit II [Bacteroidota bacterium]
MIAQATNFAQNVDNTFIIIVGICVFFLVLITTLLITFAIKYNKKRNPKAVNIHGNIKLEIIWTIIPTLIVLYIFWLGWSDYIELATPPKDAMVINATASMWQWKFTYSNGKQADTLYVPVNENIKIKLNSTDVSHSFYIPAFRIKRDAMPNTNNSTWFNAEKLGSYTLFCAEYCGLNHSKMYTEVKVVTKDKFNNWLNSE